jgi:hypothetical protein
VQAGFVWSTAAASKQKYTQKELLWWEFWLATGTKTGKILLISRQICGNSPTSPAPEHQNIHASECLTRVVSPVMLKIRSDNSLSLPTIVFDKAM